MALEIPRHVHKRGGVGQGGESKIVSTLDELARAESEGWVVDPNAKPTVETSAASEARYGVPVGSPLAVDAGQTLPAEPPAELPLPDVLDDPDGVPPVDADDDEPEGEDSATEPTKPKRGRPRKS